MKNKCEQTEAYIASLAYKMNSDIIICGVSLEEKCQLDDLRSKLDIDLEIMIQIKEERIKINILENESCKLALDYNSIGEVAQYIINILSN